MSWWGLGCVVVAAVVDGVSRHYYPGIPYSGFEFAFVFYMGALSQRKML